MVPPAEPTEPDDRIEHDLPENGTVVGHVRRRLGRPGRALGLLSCATLATGLAVAEHQTLVPSGLVVACVLTVVALALIAPFAIAVRSLAVLASRGRELACTVEEVRLLLEATATAYSTIYGAILHGPRVRPRTAGAVESGLARQAPRIEAAGQWIPAPLSPQSFWESLEPAEQEELIARARCRSYAEGAALCRQGQPADHVLIIMAGWVRVSTERGGAERDVATRGPGDLVGERAALRETYRSATVVALETVRALVIPTAEFAGFLSRHAHVLKEIERQVYGRLTEDRGAPAPTSAASGRRPLLPDAGDGAAAPVPSWNGQNCTILLTDITAFGSLDRNDGDRLTVRRAMYQVVRGSLETAGIPWTGCHREDRGDGALVVIPPEVATRKAVDPLIDLVADGLRRHNRQARQAARIQLRLAINVGPVESDPEGVSGEAIIHTARILDVPVLKDQLARGSAHLGVAVSTFVYDHVVRHRPGEVDPADYRRVDVRVKESNLSAWISLRGPG